MSCPSTPSSLNDVELVEEKKCHRCLLLMNQLTDIKLTQNNMESELLFLRKETARLMIVELQYIALKMEQNRQNAQISRGCMGYDTNEWS